MRNSIFFVGALAAGLIVGYVAGAFPFYYMINSTGGPIGVSVRRLGEQAGYMQFGAHETTAEQILKMQIERTYVTALNVANNFCSLSPELKKQAHLSALTLSKNSYMAKADPLNGKDALAYLANTQPDLSCQPFKGANFVAGVD